LTSLATISFSLGLYSTELVFQYFVNFLVNVSHIQQQFLSKHSRHMSKWRLAPAVDG